ncbi:hypothetical protein B6U71_04850 [Euryarchaeota archaeon ex4484_178]|nr:MAG: hypothetical protein B6U71_04850 [Euryarchaeota archaeon ex4484_178]
MRLSFEAKLAIILVLSAIIFYVINYFLFYDLTFIEKYLLAQLGFLPISVLLVTLVLNKLMIRREKIERIEKLNIVVGTFFAELGKDLLRYLSKYDTDVEKIAPKLINIEKFTDDEFQRVKEELSNREYSIDLRKINLYELRRFLLENKEFAINLLDNPAIIEHEAFTDLLWNVLHLTDELKRVVNFENVSHEDFLDIKNDMETLYKLLIYEWVNYVHYLKDKHPHIFIYEAKTNPLIPHAYYVKKRRS